MILATGRIPRGRAKAPEIAMPQEGIAGDELGGWFDNAVTWVERAAELPADRWFRHFALGVLDRDRALRFVEIHNRHHLQIISDIERAASDE